MSAKKGHGYKVDFPDVGKVSKGLVKRLMPDMLEVVAARAREIVPRRSGRLGDSIETRLEEEGARGAVAATARHAHLVHEGTQAHPLRSSGRAMAMASGGGFLLRKSAQHPGTRGQPFLRNALEDSKGRIAEGLRGNERALKEAVEE